MKMSYIKENVIYVKNVNFIQEGDIHRDVQMELYC